MIMQNMSAVRIVSDDFKTQNYLRIVIIYLFIIIIIITIIIYVTDIWNGTFHFMPIHIVTTFH